MLEDLRHGSSLTKAARKELEEEERLRETEKMRRWAAADIRMHHILAWAPVFWERLGLENYY